MLRSPVDTRRQLVGDILLHLNGPISPIEQDTLKNTLVKHMLLDALRRKGGNPQRHFGLDGDGSVTKVLGEDVATCTC